MKSITLQQIKRVTKFNYSALKRQLSIRKNIVIVTHWSPDGDAMGSSLGLYNFLSENHKVTVITPNEYPEFLVWLPGNKKVLVHLKEEKKTATLVKKADLIFCLDFNSLKRIDKLGDVVGASPAKKIIVDHHQEPDDFAEIVFSDTSASSTAEMIYDLIVGVGGKKSITPKIAECLYTGIMTDTGSFRYPSTTAKVHRIVGDLIEAGAQNSKIHQNIFDTNTVDKLRLIGYTLSEKMEVLPEHATAILSLKEAELKKYNYKKGDTEGLVNYGLGIQGMLVSAFFVERDGMIKISFRSKGNFDVNKFARAYFSGGGHKNAAGGQSSLSIEKTIQEFKLKLKENSPVLEVRKK